ncbi:g884 [Coccomyxa viridis]|uniref:G884 protein n=1 Tax=Coccomyxa viridis TaxID=1274662 RepID=A0ABP1FGR9_9CHLO
MELASKRFQDVLLGPSATALCRSLDLLKLRAPTPGNFRWLQKRILRYKHIKSHFSDEVLKCIEGPDGRTAPPLLPSLLATCAPAAELFLNVGPDEGENFFKIAFGASSKLDSFQANLTQHLTDLELKVDLGNISRVATRKASRRFLFNLGSGARIYLED